MDILIVGLGSMGKRRARLAAGLGHTLYGADNAAARRAEGEALGMAATYAGLDEALAARRYGAAFVCTAPLAHAGLVAALLAAGVPVFCELNLVGDGYAEAQRLARENGVPLFLSSTMLYRREIAYITRRVGQFARPVRYVYHIGQYLPDWHPWERYQDFFVGQARTGGVREIFGIELPWMLTCFGPASLRAVQKGNVSGLGLPYPDAVTAMLEHESGAAGVLAVDVVSPKAVRNLEVYGEGLHLFWEGNPAGLYTYDAEAGAKQSVDTYSHYQQDARYSDNIVENAYLDEMMNFFAVLRGEETARWSYAQDEAAIRLMDEIDRA